MRPGQICSSALGQVYILTFHGARVGYSEERWVDAPTWEFEREADAILSEAERRAEISMRAALIVKMII